MAKPVVICFSGKRKSGKDFVANLLANRLERLDYEVVVCGVSHPLKEEYAQLYDVDAERLKFDMAYKERYRADMIAWGERIRNEDPGYFCRKVAAKADSADILIVPDCRRRSDIEFFKTHFGRCLRLIRIESKLSVRELRGFKFVGGIDDQITECGLDIYDDWNTVINNDIQVVNGTLPRSLDESLSRICREDNCGVILTGYLPKSETLNSDYYCNLLEKLKVAVVFAVEKLIFEVKQWFSTKSKDFYKEGLKQVKKRRQKCVTLAGKN